MDEFVEVAGFTGYKINRNGDCIGKHGRILKRGLTEKGYEQYNLFSISSFKHQWFELNSNVSFFILYSKQVIA